MKRRGLYTALFFLCFFLAILMIFLGFYWVSGFLYPVSYEPCEVPYAYYSSVPIYASYKDDSPENPLLPEKLIRPSVP